MESNNYNDEEITLLLKDLLNRIITIKIKKSQKVSQLRKKLPHSDVQLKLQATVLKDDKKLFEYDLEDNDCILMCSRSEGGPPVDFVDIDKGKPIKMTTNPNAPDWWITRQGLNLFGICENESCSAYKKEVIITDYNKKKIDGGISFNLIEEQLKTKCPMCRKIVVVNTCGFNKCKYQIIGNFLKEGSIVSSNKEIKETSGDATEKYNPISNGIVKWETNY